MIDQIALVDTRNALCDHGTYAQVHRVDGCVFAGRSLTIVLAADDDALSHLFCPCRKLRIVAVITVLAHKRNIRAHTGEFCAGRSNIVGRDVVHRL